jgi:phage terminase large subunit-like protein
MSQSAQFASGKVHVPQDAPWLAGWLYELVALPNGRHDDQVNSTSQALDYLTARTHPLHASETHREQSKGVHRPAGLKRPLK